NERAARSAPLGKLRRGSRLPVQQGTSGQRGRRDAPPDRRPARGRLSPVGKTRLIGSLFIGLAIKRVFPTGLKRPRAGLLSGRRDAPPDRRPARGRLSPVGKTRLIASPMKRLPIRMLPIGIETCPTQPGGKAPSSTKSIRARSRIRTATASAISTASG